MAKTMNYSYQVRKEIESLNSNITDEELFSSDAFAEYIKKALDVELGVNPALKGRKIRKYLFADPSNNITAYTNNEEVTSNLLSALVMMAESREDKYYSNLGQIIHEGGHVWFTDFVAFNRWIDEITSNQFNWWPSKPTNKNADDIYNALNKYPNFKQYVAIVAKSIWNIEEDAHIEYCLSTVFGGSFMHGIRVIRDNMHKNSEELETMLTKVYADELKFSDMVLSVLLRVDFGYPIKMKDVRSVSNDPMYQYLMKFLDDTKTYRETLLTESDGEKRSSLINEILCVLWDYLPHPQEQQQPQQGQGKEGQPENSEEQNSDSSSTGDNGSENSNSKNSGGSPSNTGENKAEEGQSENNSGSQDTESTDFTESQFSDSQESLNQALKSMGGMTQLPRGNTRPVKMNQTEAEAKENSERNTINAQSGNQSDVGKAMKEIVESIATEKVESDRYKNLRQEAKEIRDKKTPQGEYLPWRYEIKRGEKDEDVYNTSLYRVKQYSNPAKRQLERIFKDRKREGKTRGYMTGMFDASSVYRTAYQNDGHNFTRRHEPDGDPDVAFGLLIDQSGSMSGTKIVSARDTAVLLDDILCNFGIPYLVVGHDVDFGTCNLNVVKDFDEVDKTAKFRLGSIYAGGRNRDGAAISYCAERLLSRPEKNKVLIVISDGFPTECGFHNYVTYMEDARLTVDEYSKRGITIFGAVIDGDFNSIKNIYGDKTMDLTDLANLPRTLSNLVKRYVIKR